MTFQKMNQLKELGLCGYNQIWESISLVLLKSQRLTVIRKVQTSLKASANKQLKGILSTDRHAVKSTTDGVMLCHYISTREQSGLLIYLKLNFRIHLNCGRARGCKTNLISLYTSGYICVLNSITQLMVWL